MAIILVLGFLLRFYPISINSAIGPDPFFHARNAELFILNKGIPQYDELSQQGRAYSYEPLLHFILSFFAIFLNLKTKIGILKLGQILSCIFGCLAILLVYIALTNIEKKAAIVGSFIIAIMPLHLVRTAAYLRPDSFALLLAAVILAYLFVKRNTGIAALAAFILPWLHPLSGILTILIITTTLFVKLIFKDLSCSEKNNAVFVSAALILSLLGFLFAVPFQSYSIEDYINLKAIMQSGEMHSFTIKEIFQYLPFSWIFIALGLAKNKSKALLGWFLGALLLCVISFRTSIHLSIIAGIIAAIGLTKSLEIIKSSGLRPLAIVFLAILALFAILSFPHYSKFPSAEVEKSLIFLKSKKNASVISRWDSGHLITFFANKPVVIDGYFEFASQLNEREKASYEILSSSNCEKILANMQKFKAEYIFIRNKNRRMVKNGILEAECNFLNKIYENKESVIFFLA